MHENERYEKNLVPRIKAAASMFSCSVLNKWCWKSPEKFARHSRIHYRTSTLKMFKRCLSSPFKRLSVTFQKFWSACIWVTWTSAAMWAHFCFYFGDDFHFSEGWKAVKHPEIRSTAQVFLFSGILFAPCIENNLCISVWNTMHTIFFRPFHVLH